MSFKITDKQFTFQSSDDLSFPTVQPEISLRSRIMHYVINFFHFTCPWLFKSSSSKVAIDEQTVIYIDFHSFDAWRNNASIREWARKHDLKLDSADVAKEIKQVLQALKLSNFKTDFQSTLAKKISLAIEEKNNELLLQTLRDASPEDLREALLEQDVKKQANILAYAAHKNNGDAIDCITSVVDDDLLQEILVQEDKHGWTALHHLAIMNDGGKRYKELKKRAGIDAKTVSKFFCESPYMLRKYIRSQAGRFSTLSEKREMHLYFKDVNHQDAEEQHLSYDNLVQKYGTLFSREPKNFKSIPQLRAEFLQAIWEDLPDDIQRNESRLQMLDQHLKKILAEGEEKGICLAHIRYDDKGEKLPEDIEVGIGALARTAFQTNDIVTLYGGEYFTEKHPKPDDYKSEDYTFGSFDKEDINGLNVRSYGSSFTHSAPNIRFEQIRSKLGFTFLSMTANNAINPTDPLCLNYGPRYFKSRKILPLETRPAAREEMKKTPSQDSAAKWSQESYLEIDARVA